MVLLTVPVFSPLVLELGFDLIWFGIVVVIATEISLITPPIGLNVFVLRSMLPPEETAHLFRALIPFWLVDILRLVLIVLLPPLTLLLPRLMG